MGYVSTCEQISERQAELDHAYNARQERKSKLSRRSPPPQQSYFVETEKVRWQFWAKDRKRRTHRTIELRFDKNLSRLEVLRQFYANFGKQYQMKAFRLVPDDE